MEKEIQKATDEFRQGKITIAEFVQKWEQAHVDEDDRIQTRLANDPNVVFATVA